MQQYNDKVKSLIGFAIKAGKVTFGSDNILAYSKKKYLVVICKTLSENGVKRLLNNLQSVPILKTKTCELSSLVFRDNCKAIALTDRQMASAILNNYNNNDYELLSEGK